MNTNIINNYSKLKPALFALPVLLLMVFVFYILLQHGSYPGKYIQVQQRSFFFINSVSGEYAGILWNLTQLGDALILLSFLSIFILYAPTFWESLISGLLVSLIFSSVLKKVFAVPRPAAVFDNDSFFIIGKKLVGHNSFPSGHSMTIFTAFTVLMFAFMPQKRGNKILWIFFIVIAGLALALTRVGVGAHYPLDVAGGGIIGFISGLAGIFICRKYKIWRWIGNKKYYPFFILLFLGGCVSLIQKIMNENLIVFYLALLGLMISLYKTIDVYVKK